VALWVLGFVRVCVCARSWGCGSGISLTLIVQWCKGVAFSFHWVKGHADCIDRPLTRDERLSIEEDIHKDAIYAQACGPIAARPNCPHWDIEEA
jgi:hypothetical protein